jgi:hypothetical protein
MGAVHKLCTKIAAEMGIEDPTDDRVLSPLIELLEEQAARTTATTAVAAPGELITVATKLGTADSSGEAIINAITLLQDGAVTAQQQRDDAVTERETTEAAIAKLQADATTAQQQSATATAALQQKVTAATQRADDIGSAVRGVLLDLGESLGSGTSIPEVGPRLH